MTNIGKRIIRSAKVLGLTGLLGLAGTTSCVSSCSIHAYGDFVLGQQYNALVNKYGEEAILDPWSCSSSERAVPLKNVPTEESLAYINRKANYDELSNKNSLQD